MWFYPLKWWIQSMNEDIDTNYWVQKWLKLEGMYDTSCSFDKLCGKLNMNTVQAKIHPNILHSQPYECINSTNSSFLESILDFY